MTNNTFMADALGGEVATAAMHENRQVTIPPSAESRPDETSEDGFPIKSGMTKKVCKKQQNEPIFWYRTTS